MWGTCLEHDEKDVLAEVVKTLTSIVETNKKLTMGLARLEAKVNKRKRFVPGFGAGSIDPKG